MKTFLSYPSEKLSIAREIYEFLLSLNIKSWFDKESLIGGQKWDRERAIAQKSADLIVLVCSAETVSRAGVIQNEIKEALDLLRDKPPGHVFLVSLRTDDINLPPELEDYQYIDLFRPGWQFKLARSVLLRFEQLGTAPPAALSAFIKSQETAGGIELKSLRYEGHKLQAEADYFLYQRNGLFWDYINAEIIADVVGSYYRSRTQGSYYLKDQDRKGDWSLRVEEHYATNDLVSLRFFDWSDFGGVHPNRGVYAKNFVGPEVGKLSISDLFDRDPSVLAHLRKYCELDIRRQMLNGDEEPDYNLPGENDDIYADAWEIFSQWNFSPDGLLICFSQNCGLPYVMGVFDVLVPWDNLREKVSSEFKDTALGKLIAPVL